MGKLERYSRRRRRVLELLAAHPLTVGSGGHAVAVLFSTPVSHRNSDVEHPYRADSDLAWLTGFEEPEAALVLAPGRPDGESVLFLRVRDPDQERWNGRRLGLEAATTALGIDQALAIERLDAELPRLMHQRRALFAHFGRDDDKRLFRAAAVARARCRRQGKWPVAFIDLAELLHPLRQIKDDDELAALERAARITGEAHRRAMAATAPGVLEADLEAEIAHTFRRGGAQRPGYGSIVATGANACILHYVENDARIADGDLVLVDAGAEVDLYTADVTRTWPASGRFTSAQRDVYDIVLAANVRAIDAVKPGATMRGVDDVARRVLAEGLVSLGILEGSIAELTEKRPYDGMPEGNPGRAPLDRYYMHGTGHWLGSDVHDAGPYHDGRDPLPLAPRMVLTVEPGLYLDVGDDSVPPALQGIGIRIEDDVVVTADGVRVLTTSAPKSVEAVEALVGSAPLLARAEPK